MGEGVGLEKDSSVSELQFGKGTGIGTEFWGPRLELSKEHRAHTKFLWQSLEEQRNREGERDSQKQRTRGKGQKAFANIQHEHTGRKI